MVRVKLCYRNQGICNTLLSSFLQKSFHSAQCKTVFFRLPFSQKVLCCLEECLSVSIYFTSPFTVIVYSKGSSSSKVILFNILLPLMKITYNVKSLIGYNYLVFLQVSKSALYLSQEEDLGDRSNIMLPNQISVVK